MGDSCEEKNGSPMECSLIRVFTPTMWGRYSSVSQLTMEVTMSALLLIVFGGVLIAVSEIPDLPFKHNTNGLGKERK